MESSGKRASRAVAARAGGERLSIGLLAERRYLAEAQPLGLRDALVAAGHAVRLVDVEATVRDPRAVAWLDRLDLVVARGRSLPVLDLLARAEWAGVATLNRRAAIAAVLDRAVMGVLLQLGSVAAPHTRLGTPAALARSIPAARYPLVIKPVYGGSGGLRLVRTPAALTSVAREAPADAPVLAQAFVPSDGWSLKLHVIGDELHAVRAPSPLCESRTQAAEPVSITPALTTLARRCRALFGLELFGVDCLETSDGLVVTGVDDFPNYTGVARASERLATFVAARALSARGVR